MSKFSLLFRRERLDDLLEARIAAEPVPKVASVPTYQSSGLARMERANPLVVQTLDVVRSFYRPGSRVAVPTPVPVAPAPTIWLVQIFCAPGPTYMLKLGPSVIEMVPVQSAATV